MPEMECQSFPLYRVICHPLLFPLPGLKIRKNVKQQQKYAGDASAQNCTIFHSLQCKDWEEEEEQLRQVHRWMGCLRQQLHLVSDVSSLLLPQTEHGFQ